MYDDFAPWPRNLDAFAGIFVIVPAPILEGGIARRNLHDASDETWQDRLDILPGYRHVACLQHLTFGVARSRRRAEANEGDIGLVGVEQHVRELGCFTETDRQQAACQRIERSGMARLFGAKLPLRLLQCGVGRQPDRLVEEQDAIDAAAQKRRRSGAAHQLGCLRSSATASSISFESLRPDSIESS